MKLLYEGKAKQVFETEDAEIVRIHYKDDATALNGLKKESIEQKGILNNAITSMLYRRLKEKGIQTHYLKTLNDRDQLCVKVSIIPLEVIVRNAAAGSMAKLFQLEEGTALAHPVIEICYKNDELKDPMINRTHAIALNLATEEELNYIEAEVIKINEILTEIFDKIGIQLIDFKVEFGKDQNGTILLADEISPDTCRLWDKQTGEKLDKDRFRRDLGGVIEAYQEIAARLSRLEKNA